MKLVVVEAESPALRSWLAPRRERASSVIAAIELRRAVRRTLAGRHASQAERLASETEVLLRSVTFVALDDEVARRAAGLDPAALRTLDSIHVATALGLPSLEALVTYDARLAQAAVSAGLVVSAPGA